MTIRDEILGRENFKPIKISAGRPRFTISRYGVILNVGAMKALGFSEYVQVLIDEKSDKLMLVGCGEAGESTVELHANGSRGARIFSKELQATIAELAGFGSSAGSVRLPGERVRGEAAVIFDLKEARRSGGV